MWWHHYKSCNQNEHSTTFEVKSIPSPHFDPRDIQPDDEEIPELFVASGEPEEVAPPTTNTVGEVETCGD